MNLAATSQAQASLTPEIPNSEYLARYLRLVVSLLLRAQNCPEPESDEDLAAP